MVLSGDWSWAGESKRSEGEEGWEPSKCAHIDGLGRRIKTYPWKERSDVGFRTTMATVQVSWRIQLQHFHIMEKGIKTDSSTGRGDVGFHTTVWEDHEKGNQDTSVQRGQWCRVGTLSIMPTNCGEENQNHQYKEGSDVGSCVYPILP